jgi:hypothetical protein
LSPRGAARLVLAAILLTGLAACGSPTPGHPGSAVAPAGSSYYLASSSTEVDLVTWNANGAGTITTDTIDSSGSDPSAPYSLKVQTANVSVAINGSQVTITASSWFGSATINGTMNGDGSLTITAPPDSSTGQISSGTLEPSSPDKYNAAVDALNATISIDNSQAAAAQQQAAQQQASASASAAQAQQVAQDQATAQNDISSLASAVQGMQSDLQSMNGDVSSAANDLQSEKNDAAQGQGSNCDNVSVTVNNDASVTLNNDLTVTIANDLQVTLSQDLSTVRGDISSVQSDVQALQNDGVSVPPTGVGDAQNAVTSVIQQANANNATVTGYVDTGYQIANNLAYGACAGMGPGSPPSPPGNLS